MNTQNIEKLAAMALLDRGIAFAIPAPWPLRLVGKKQVQIVVKQMYLGTLLHLSTLDRVAPLEVVSVPEERKQVLEAMEAQPVSLPAVAIAIHAKTVCKVVAACLLNSSIKIMLFQNILAGHLRRNCTPEQLQELLMWLFAYSRPEAFTNTIKLIDRMKMTKPMNLSHE